MQAVVISLIAVLTMTALALDTLVLHLRLDAAMTSVELLTVVGAVVAFAVAEVLVMHVELGRNAHSVSLAELVLIVSLFFLPAAALPLARLLGGGAALLLIRRQRPIKVMFNASVWTLDIAAATLVFRSLGGGLGLGTERLIIPATVAALTAAAVDSVAVNAVIAITSREIQPRSALRFLATCLANGLACSTLGVVCVAALGTTPWLLVPILLVVTAVMAGFYRFGALRRQHHSTKVLYDFTDELARTPHGRAVVHTVLERVVELLRAERASLWLDAGDGQLTVTRVQLQGRPTSESLPLEDAPQLIRQALHTTAPLIVRAGDRQSAHAAFLDRDQLRDALLAPVTSRQGLRGVLAVANRLGEVSSFGVGDGRLLQTLANHAGTAVANSRLVDALNHDSTHDSLTGLANRAHFQQRLARALSTRGNTAVLLMDLDRFKEVNDTLGHHHGDLLLQQIADRLRGQLRKQDLLARLGGDEFAILMKRVTEEQALASAQRLRLALAQPMQLQGVDMEVNASIGIAVTHQRHSDDEVRSDGTDGHAPVPADRDVTAVAMLQQADVAMYAAKRVGTGVEIYRQDQDDHSPRRLALASSLRAAIHDGQLTLRYQPQARLSDGSIVGVEALVRWEHPTFGEVSPEDFIGIAEQTGQIRELTRHVLDQALADCVRWQQAGTPLVVSVNVSVRNLLEADLLDAVSRLLRQHGVPSHLLTLEITESHLMADATRTRQTLHELAALGIRLSVDDFGTGYSSLAYLKQLPVREVKIDKSFVRNLGSDASDAAIVEAIVQLAHTLRLEVVAEGVEDEESRSRLAQLGCDFMQGYHLAAPMRPADIDGWLAAHRSAVGRPLLRALPTPRPTAAGDVAGHGTA